MCGFTLIVMAIKDDAEYGWSDQCCLKQKGFGKLSADFSQLLHTRKKPKLLLHAKKKLKLLLILRKKPIQFHNHTRKKPTMLLHSKRKLTLLHIIRKKPALMHAR